MKTAKRKPTGIDFSKGDIKDFDRTRRGFTEDCDINKIVARCVKTQDYTILTGNQIKSRYGDFSDIDYQASMQTMAEMKSNYENLPEHIRNQFTSAEAWGKVMVEKLDLTNKEHLEKFKKIKKEKLNQEKEIEQQTEKLLEDTNSNENKE